MTQYGVAGRAFSCSAYFQEHIWIIGGCSDEYVCYDEIIRISPEIKVKTSNKFIEKTYNLYAANWGMMAVNCGEFVFMIGGEKGHLTGMFRLDQAGSLSPCYNNKNPFMFSKKLGLTFSQNHIFALGGYTDDNNYLGSLYKLDLSLTLPMHFFSFSNALEVKPHNFRFFCADSILKVNADLLRIVLSETDIKSIVSHKRPGVCKIKEINQSLLNSLLERAFYSYNAYSVDLFTLVTIEHTKFLPDLAKEVKDASYGAWDVNCQVWQTDYVVRKSEDEIVEMSENLERLIDYVKNPLIKILKVNDSRTFYLMLYLPFVKPP